MRITGGRLKGREIRAPKGKTTRPALSRVRRSLLDTLRPWLPDGCVLDLFCGSGAFLFEALSRGAASAVGVDLDREAVRTIRDNARALELAAALLVHPGDALDLIARLHQRGERFDVVFCAPPYWLQLQPKALDLLDRHPLLAPEGILVVQRDRKEPPTPPALATLTQVRERTYGNTVLAYYQTTPTGGYSDTASRARLQTSSDSLASEEKGSSDLPLSRKNHGPSP